VKLIELGPRRGIGLSISDKVDRSVFSAVVRKVQWLIRDQVATNVLNARIWE
jgi:hypothetical protein